MGLKERVSSIVLSDRFIFIVLAAVQLNHQFCGSDVEVGDIATKHLLPVDRPGQHLEEIVPQMLFFRGHLFPKTLGIGCELLVLGFVHKALPVKELPSPWGEGGPLAVDEGSLPPQEGLRFLDEVPGGVGEVFLRVVGHHDGLGKVLVQGKVVHRVPGGLGKGQQ